MPRDHVRLPKQGSSHVESGILHAVVLAGVALSYTRGRATGGRRLRAQLEQASSEIALLREELSIKDGRWERSHPHRRPHYTPIQRMRILQLRAARGWTLEKTARVFLVDEQTLLGWMSRLDEPGGPFSPARHRGRETRMRNPQLGRLPAATDQPRFSLAGLEPETLCSAALPGKRRDAMRHAVLLALFALLILASAPVAAQGGPCSGSFPMCNGSCAPTESCVSGESGTNCVCVPRDNPCSSSASPECDGVCPAGQTCSDTGAACVCVADPAVPCASTTPADECGGACPLGLRCGLDESGATPVCACLPELTECGLSGPTCGGDCPEGEVCQTLAGGGCNCVPGPPCGSSPSGTCDGHCTLDGYRCVLDGPSCACLPVDVACSSAAAPECDGRCPDGTLCAPAAVGGCTCQQLACGSSPFPECAGSCPSGSTCRAGPTGCGCVNDSIPCSATLAPECGGVCPVGSLCRIDATGGGCACLPVGVACGDATAPVCEGACPTGLFCEESATGAGCECVTPTPCSGTTAPECGGACPQGDVCIEGILGDCVCEPLPSDCDESPFPVCGGSCPDAHRCEGEAGSGACRCRDCVVEGLTPGPESHLVWASKLILRWSRPDCAVTYNVYRHGGPFVDGDHNGAADDYGPCLASGLTTPQLTDSSSAGGLYSYVVTGVSAGRVEGPLGTASSGASRPHPAPCP